eukprot:3545286-Pyramimonas_sp.AAC.1
MVSRGPKEALKRLPRGSQDAPESSPRGPERLPRSTENASGSRWGRQEDPKHSERPPRGSHEA